MNFKLMLFFFYKMSNFPLYDSLIKDLPSIDLTDIQKKAFVKRVEKIDKNGHELIYALIRTYQYQNTNNNTQFTLPYNGTFIENDLHFDLEIMPVELKHILFKFASIHLEKMKKDVV